MEAPSLLNISRLPPYYSVREIPLSLELRQRKTTDTRQPPRMQTGDLSGWEVINSADGSRLRRGGLAPLPMVAAEALNKHAKLADCCSRLLRRGSILLVSAKIMPVNQ